MVRTLVQRMINLYSALNDDLNKAEGTLAKAGGQADVWAEECPTQAPATSQVYFTITGYYLPVSPEGPFLVYSMTSTSDYGYAIRLCWSHVYQRREEQGHSNMERGMGWIHSGKDIHGMLLNKGIHNLQVQYNVKKNLKLVILPPELHPIILSFTYQDNRARQLKIIFKRFY